MATSQQRLEIGDACPGKDGKSCGGRIGVVSTFVKSGYRTQYLRCKCCGYSPDDNKRVKPL